MINKSKQNWQVGSKVNVGFLKGLTVVGTEETPGDYRPDVYTLVNESTGAKYEFTPHNGIVRVG